MRLGISPSAEGRKALYPHWNENQARLQSVDVLRLSDVQRKRAGTTPLIQIE
jgi:hypothetical protein